MTARRVTRTDKNADRDIIALCNPDQAWSRISKAKAIREIESGENSYYVLGPRQQRTEIIVVEDKDKGKYLRTKGDQSKGNNLQELPAC